MRIIFTLPLLALAACQVTTDDQNDQVSVQYNADIAENGVEAAAAKAEQIGDRIANDVQQTADKVEDKVDNVSIDVDVDTDGGRANANAN